jgi:hypothetical protein
MTIELKKIMNSDFQYVIYSTAGGGTVVRIVNTTGDVIEIDITTDTKDFSFLKWQLEDTLHIFQLNGKEINHISSTIIADLN